MRFMKSSKVILFMGLCSMAAAPVVRSQITSNQPNPTAVSQALTVVLTDRGFRPAKLYLKAGTTGMLIQNRSRIQALTVNIVQSGQTAAGLTSKHTATQRDNTFYFTVQPGTYNFVVAEQPTWSCVLEVSAK